MRRKSKPRRKPSRRKPKPSTSPAYAWGAAQIGAAIGLNRRQAYHLLEIEAIKSASKKGGKWFANVDALRREFGGEEAR